MTPDSNKPTLVCYDGSEHYRRQLDELGVLPEDIRSLEDLAALPILLDKEARRRLHLDDLPKISARVLSARLRELVAKGVVSRRVVQTTPPSVEYELTSLGRELVPALSSIVEVATKLRQRRA